MEENKIESMNVDKLINIFTHAEPKELAKMLFCVYSVLSEHEIREGDGNCPLLADGMYVLSSIIDGVMDMDSTKEREYTIKRITGQNGEGVK